MRKSERQREPAFSRDDRELILIKLKTRNNSTTLRRPIMLLLVDEIYSTKSGQVGPAKLLSIGTASILWREFCVHEHVSLESLPFTCGSINGANSAESTRARGRADSAFFALTPQYFFPGLPQIQVTPRLYRWRRMAWKGDPAASCAK